LDKKVSRRFGAVSESEKWDTPKHKSRSAREARRSLFQERAIAMIGNKTLYAGKDSIRVVSKRSGGYVHNPFTQTYICADGGNQLCAIERINQRHLFSLQFPIMRIHALFPSSQPADMLEMKIVTKGQAAVADANMK
jgi:hypothetical protein